MALAFTRNGATVRSRHDMSEALFAPTLAATYFTISALSAGTSGPA